MAQAKSTQTGSSPARPGLNRLRTEQRRGTGAATSSTTARPTLPLAGAGGRRGGRAGNPINFVRDVRSELRKVAWPSQRETINLTVVVIALSVSVGLFLGGTDFVFQELFRFLLGVTGSSSF